MLSEIAVVLCALLALQASFGYCFPTGQNGNIPYENDKTLSQILENDEEDGYQIILLSPTQRLKVEVVDSAGNTALEDKELISQEDTAEEATEQLDLRIRSQGRTLEESIEEEESEEEVLTEGGGSVKCNWLRLYKLFLKKHKQSRSGAFSQDKKEKMREAFKIVCENPEDVIKLLLNME